MFERVFHYLNYFLPWWLQPLILCFIAVAVGVFVHRTVGIRGALATLFAFALVILSRGSYKKGQSDGYSAAKDKVESDGKRLVAEAKRARDRVDAAINSGSVYDDDGFKRPD